MEYQIKDIEGYEGLYQVDTNGDVWSLNYNHTGERRKMKTSVVGNGYLGVNLYKDQRAKKCKVHRLVAEAFIENPMNLPEVNHKDEDKTNNLVDNLEFCDRRYNLEYSGIIYKAAKASAKARSKVVVQFTKDGQFVAEYPSTHEASRHTGINHGNISSCCLEQRKSASGYRWKYMENDKKMLNFR